jgi:small subunit ribosomal protein S25e
MGGSKNKSPAQKEKAQQKKDAEQKKGKKSKSEDSKTEISVLIDESQALKYIKSANVITAHDLARNTSVKISTANSFLQKSLDKGIVKRIGGFSGHHVYQTVSE